MTELPRDMDDAAPREADVERAQEKERVDLDPEDQPNAPNREPVTERVGPNADPDQVPGPLEPGENAPDRPDDVTSFEQPGGAGNWDDQDMED
ncbi:MAG TPA: hypothetical protein VH419_00950 [Nocardioidaceae bacterium]